MGMVVRTLKEASQQCGDVKTESLWILSTNSQGA